MGGFENILVEVERGRARITLNRPEKLNALSIKLLEELSEALWDADADREVHSVILRGAGRSFSAGYDLTEPPRSEGRRGGASYRGGRSIDDDIWQLERAQRFRMAIFDMAATLEALSTSMTMGNSSAISCAGAQRRGRDLVVDPGEALALVGLAHERPHDADPGDLLAEHLVERVDPHLHHAELRHHAQDHAPRPRAAGPGC